MRTVHKKVQTQPQRQLKENCFFFTPYYLFTKKSWRDTHLNPYVTLAAMLEKTTGKRNIFPNIDNFEDKIYDTSVINSVI